MNVVIIGCGLIGRKRALALGSDDKLIACCDVDRKIGEVFAKDFNCKFYNNYLQLFDEVSCDAVIVSVVNKYIKEIVLCALEKGVSVLAEKPLGRNVQEAKLMNEKLEQVRKTKNVILKTGFNHRFHPGIWKTKELIDNDAIGKLLNIRARYGHGGRPGMENEWRASKDLCGGGELLDQGVHLIDLTRWFVGEIKNIFGIAKTKFWNMNVEDNAFVYMLSESNVDIQFHVSWTNWKNVFSYEIFGTDGYIKVEGLGGSYGTETIEIGKRKKEGGRPDIEVIEFPSEDVSWKLEWKEFKNALEEKRDPIGSGIDGLRANEIIEGIYRSSNEFKLISL